MAAALALTVPFGLVFFNWIATLWGGTLHLRAPLLFALGAISTIAIGLTGELAESVIPVAWQLSGTTAATMDTHYALIGGSIFGGFAALHYWFPKLTGRTMGEGAARASFWLLLAGVHLTFAPMFFAGAARPARRRLQATTRAPTSPATTSSRRSARWCSRRES